LNTTASRSSDGAERSGSGGDILASTAGIRHHIAGMSLDTFSNTPTVVRPVLYSVSVIGKAVKRLSGDFKAVRQHVP
jgi:uncharacterized protein with HEPN domain